MNIRCKGEDIWWNDRHVANIRLVSRGDKPFVVQKPSGEICFEAAQRHIAELWIRIHATELLTATHRTNQLRTSVPAYN